MTGNLLKLSDTTHVVAVVAAALTLGGCNKDNVIDDDSGEALPGNVRVEVIDYSPAPGQFINIVPAYAAGDDATAINRKATDALNSGDYISLGAWGGSITLRLDRYIRNIPGRADFAVLGNAYYTPAASDGRQCGNSEPGIILVMEDRNRNGKPDDGWYEIPGSENARATDATYSVTYNILGPRQITWTDNLGATGTLYDGSDYHEQPFVPQWLNVGKTMTFTGRRLPDNGFYDSESMQYKQYVYDGYADCRPNNDAARGIDISSAVDTDGRPANLSRVDFIRIYTAVLQVNGPMGECSTEVAGIEALH